MQDRANNKDNHKTDGIDQYFELEILRSTSTYICDLQWTILNKFIWKQNEEDSVFT
jgi:hypothetical protein